MKQRVSIIIPTLNEAPTIRDTVIDLAGSRELGHEVILADGGSNDQTVSLAGPHVDRIVHTTKGRARQMNAGARAAGGDILVFLHADTRLAAGAIESIQRGLANPSACWGRFDVRLSGHASIFRLIETMMNWRSRLTGIASGDQAIFVRRRLFQDIGGFPCIALMEDIALSRRLKDLSPPICLAEPVLTSSRRWERDGVIATILRMWALRLAFAVGTKPSVLARYYD